MDVADKQMYYSFYVGWPIGRWNRFFNPLLSSKRIHLGILAFLDKSFKFQKLSMLTVTILFDKH